ncbi:MAG: MXAN_5187 C-terminal domain-containing protein [Pyrinomonadaceae bacterium]
MALRRNRLGAGSQTPPRQEKKIVVRDAQPTVDEQLTRLEDDLRRLKVEFDIYFNGGTKRPPYDTKGRVETMIKRLGDDRTFNFAQRYHYNTLVARHTAFRDLWRRTMQDREEGRTAAGHHHVASRRREAAEKVAEVRTPGAAFVCADARTEVPTIKSLYDTLVAAKRECGESVDGLSFPQFHRLVVSKTEALKQSLSCERVRYSVSVENGQVSFKAKAEKGGGEGE